jgi:hypothetical protein
LLINILTLLIGTAMIVSTGRLVGLMSACKIGPGAPSTENGKYKQAKLQTVLIGIGAIFIGITHMMKGLLRLPPTSWYFDKR